MRVYLDSCALSRLLDLPLNKEIQTEAKAVNRILKEVAKGNIKLVSSDVLWNEAEAIKNNDKRFLIEGILMKADVYVTVNPDREQRARKLTEKGITYFDALHAVCAEDGANVFLTVDKRLLKKLKKLNNLKVEVMNPVEFWRRHASS